MRLYFRNKSLGTHMWLFLKTAVFTLIAPATVGTFLPRHLAARSGAGAAGWPFTWLALLPLAAGASMYLWSAWDFVTFGRGTPAPIDAPVRLVVRGLYRYVRNPMYVGVLLMAGGWTLYFASSQLATYALGLGVLFQLFVILYEEPALRRRFGDEYAAYRRQVHRWIPRRPIGRRA